MDLVKPSFHNRKPISRAQGRRRRLRAAQDLRSRRGADLLLDPLRVPGDDRVRLAARDLRRSGHDRCAARDHREPRSRRSGLDLRGSDHRRRQLEQGGPGVRDRPRAGPLQRLGVYRRLQPRDQRHLRGVRDAPVLEDPAAPGRPDRLSHARAGRGAPGAGLDRPARRGDQQRDRARGHVPHHLLNRQVAGLGRRCLDSLRGPPPRGPERRRAVSRPRARRLPRHFPLAACVELRLPSTSPISARTRALTARSPGSSSSWSGCGSRTWLSSWERPSTSSFPGAGRSSPRRSRWQATSPPSAHRALRPSSSSSSLR